MGHAYLFAPRSNTPTANTTFQVGANALEQFKKITLSESATSPQASLAVAQATRSNQAQIHRSPDNQIWLVSLGTWLPNPAQKNRDAAWLINEYAQIGPVALAKQLQGLFAIFIVDQRNKQTHVITDRCGSLHVYWQSNAEGESICTSSAALAMASQATLNPIAVHEFIATGVVYEDRSLWNGIRKIGPATVLTIDQTGTHTQQYWTFNEVKAETLALDDAVDQAFEGLVNVLKALPETSAPMVSDLTGGYDSRLLLAGLLKSGRTFETTVSGQADHPDVRVAAEIALQTGIHHQNISASPTPHNELFDAALRMTDGEYDAFDYARILDIHRQLSAKYGMSLNGSFGELARGYWWELLWPKLAANAPLNANMLSRKRFAAIPYDKSIFAGEANFDLAEHMTQVIQRTLQPIRHLPNTTQMDCAYYTLRMQRWQGRIASSTNQLWPSFSPMAFSEVLDPILAARANGRFRSLMARRLFQRHTSKLSNIPLEHGYPPVPANLFNIWRFHPIFGHYLERIWKKLASKLHLQTKPALAKSPTPQVQPANQQDQFLSDANQIGVTAPHLINSGLFVAEKLTLQLQSSTFIGEQRNRLITLEALLYKAQKQK